MSLTVHVADKHSHALLPSLAVHVADKLYASPLLLFTSQTSSTLLLSLVLTRGMQERLPVGLSKARAQQPRVGGPPASPRRAGAQRAGGRVGELQLAYSSQEHPPLCGGWSENAAG